MTIGLSSLWLFTNTVRLLIVLEEMYQAKMWKMGELCKKRYKLLKFFHEVSHAKCPRSIT